MLRVHFIFPCLLISLVFGNPIKLDSKPLTVKSNIDQTDFNELSKEIFLQTLHLKDSLEQYYQTDLAGTLLLESFGFYLHFQGLNSVYRWSVDEFVNLYDRNFNGFNFESFTFIRDSSLYNYGGSGFWQNNGILSYFKEDLREWEFLYSTRPDLELYHNAAKIHFIIDDELYLIYNESLDQNRLAVNTDWVFGKLNLSEYNYVSIKENQEVLLQLVNNTWYRGFDGADFFISLNYIGQKINIIDKTSLAFTEVPNKNLSNVNFPLSNKWLNDHLAIVLVNGNEFEFLDYNLQRLGFLDLNLLNKSAYSWQSLTEDFNFLGLLLFFSISILTLGFFIIWKIKSTHPKNIIQRDVFPYPLLLELDNQVISQQHLHHVLGIDSHLSNDSKRTKRARILREIKLLYPELISIERIVDGSDRRIFNYRIKVYK
ncbi:MAG: hypothetical protein RLZZ248_1471 [Bacteroidota bacterium]